MSRIDQELILAEKQTVTTSSDSGVASEHQIDLGKAGLAIGTGTPVYALVEVTTAMTDAGSDSALHVDLRSDSAAAMDDTPVVHQRLCTIPAASPAGTKFGAVIAPGVEMKRYLAALFTSTNGALTTGAFSVMLTTDLDLYKAYEAARVVEKP